MKKSNVTFSDLPLPHKKALLEYCSMALEEMKDLKNFYDSNRVTFTIEDISLEEAKARWKKHHNNDWSWDCKDFDEYHRIYVGDGSHIPNHGNSMYPVIEGGDDEWLDDGWHRFHSYIKYGKRTIPVLSFCDN